MSKSALYVANTSDQTVQVNGIIIPGTIIRRFGPNLGLAGNAIQVSGPGYYEIDASITVAPTAAGDVTVTIYKDGAVLQGATATESVSAGGDFATLSITTMIREFCQCCDGLTNFTFVLTGVESVVSNIAITVEKL